jgi:hypothetical protein
MLTTKHSQTEGQVQPSTGLDQEASTALAAASYDTLAGFWRHLRRCLPLDLSQEQGFPNVLATMQRGILGALADVPWRSHEKAALASRVGQIVNNDAFIDEASAAIGLPKEDETEDAYVERGKAVFRRLLRNALTGIGPRPNRMVSQHRPADGTESKAA